MTIVSPDDNVSGSATITVRDVPLYIKPSMIDSTSPEMYNYDGEQLFFVNMPVEELVTGAVEKAAAKGRRILTLAKMDKNIAAAGVSHKVNPAFGVKPSAIIEFSTTTKGGQTIMMKPQYDQYQFYSNRGVTKILGVLENTGTVLEFVNILQFALNDGEPKKLLPLPGILGLLNIPTQHHFNEMAEVSDSLLIADLNSAKKRGLKFVESGITSPAYKNMGHRLVPASDETVKKLLNGEIKTERAFMAACQKCNSRSCRILYRRIVTKSDCKIVIETFFFDIK